MLQTQTVDQRTLALLKKLMSLEELKNFHLSEIINFCELKFPDKDLYHYIRSLIYFKDVETNDKERIQLIKEADWDQVKKRIESEAKKLNI